MSTDASTRGRRNRANGADYERKIARYLATWWPDAVRAVRNSVPDPGDIDGTSPGLWWSAKNCQDDRYTAWLAELAAKKGGRIGILVVRRRGYADPGRWWAWLTLADLAALTGATAHEPVADEHVRMELHVLAALLVAGGYSPSSP